MFASTQILRRAALALALSASASLAQAATMHVELDTGFLSGLNGFLDLQFGSNNGAVAASALVSGLSGVDASAPVLMGDVTALPGGAYRFGNSTDFNDLFQSLHFGGKVSFNVSFSGLPDASASPAASPFSVGLYGDDGVTVLGNADAAGSVLHLSWLPDANGVGSVSTQVVDATAVHAVTAVPEPSAWLMLGAGLGLLGLLRRRRGVSHN